MDCTIKIISGPEAGQVFACTAPETVIGRAPRCAIRLTSPGISYEHAVITRIGDEVFIENLSANGTQIQDERVSGKTRLRLRDQIRFAPDTVARVETLPAAAGRGSARRWLLAAVVLMLVATLLVVVWDPFNTSPTTPDLARVYGRLAEYTQREVSAHRLPPETQDCLRDAWRFEAAGDRAGAGRMWLRLQVILSSTQVQSLSDRNPRALTDMLRAKPGAPAPDNSILGAALLQFAARMAQRT